MNYPGVVSPMTTLVHSGILRLGLVPETKNPKHQSVNSASKNSESQILSSGFSLSPSNLSVLLGSEVAGTRCNAWIVMDMASLYNYKGLCRASQVAELFPNISPEIVVREARIEDCWEVAETHCSSFFPDHSFPLDFVLRIDRLAGMVFGFSIPKSCQRTCLVAAVTRTSGVPAFSFGGDDFKIGVMDGKCSLNKGYVAGILTVDTVADFLPKKGPLRQRRTGIAYISNVAVREKYRRQGIAKRLISQAEAKAKCWGCRAIALHCDIKNPGATRLYLSNGFKCIKVPEGANWPQPKISADMQFNFMMKLL